MTSDTDECVIVGSEDFAQYLSCTYSVLGIRFADVRRPKLVMLCEVRVEGPARML